MSRFKSFGGRKVREIAPSKGEKRYRRHNLHKPGTLGNGRRYKELDCVRLFYNLQKMGWTFGFTITASSPRGFKYEAAGATPEECFLKAFGQWKKEMPKPEKKVAYTKVVKPKIQMSKPAPRLALDDFQPDRYGVIKASWERNLVAA